MKVAIVGSRDYDDLAEVEDFVKSLPKDTVVISGGARGVDSAAEGHARDCGYTVEVFPADWSKHGNSAGAIRNQEIVNACDLLVAFWDGDSAGTRISMDMARRVGKLRTPAEALTQIRGGKP